MSLARTNERPPATPAQPELLPATRDGREATSVLRNALSQNAHLSLFPGISQKASDPLFFVPIIFGPKLPHFPISPSLSYRAYHHSSITHRQHCPFASLALALPHNSRACPHCKCAEVTSHWRSPSPLFRTVLGPRKPRPSVRTPPKPGRIRSTNTPTSKAVVYSQDRKLRPLHRNGKLAHLTLTLCKTS